MWTRAFYTQKSRQSRNIRESKICFMFEQFKNK